MTNQGPLNRIWLFMQEWDEGDGVIARSPSGPLLHSDLEIVTEQANRAKRAEAERDQLTGQVQRVRRIAQATTDAIDAMLALPLVRDADLRAGLVDVIRIQRAALDGDQS